ncbi:uncharacterized protein LOC143855712 [Tasmannia lanceolata]|uniref:uncharacterized protein LOC143855712 n=1 Tax=Tasmannia lanceolata TaxID=3420 RepID=UPI00406460C3
MLSIENPPDPSCSTNISRLKADERVTHKLAFQEADLVKESLDEKHQLPNFSIRDYVFTARSKDIGVNWPFPQQFLQLCLKHGVQDILPPFEPPDSIKNWYCKNSVGSDQLIPRAVGEKTLPEDDGEEEKLCRLSSFFGSNDAVGEGNIVSAVTNHVQIEGDSTPLTDSLPCSVPETNSFLEASIDLQAPEPSRGPDKTELFCQPQDKKSRLLAKLGVISESIQTEEIVTNSSTVSEPMASNVCPVCGTFSSTSNTTLNAHIDQCLAVDSTSKWSVTKVTDHKVKPRKKRLMVDIYATAPHCTLEELERRNGLSRAIDLSSPIPNDEVQVERKRRQLVTVDFGDNGNESAVYIDSNGTKLRILSKFNDSLAPTVEEDHERRKHLKDGKEGRSLSIIKKRCLASKCSNYLQVKPQSKKLCSLKLYKDKICGAPDGEYHMENHEKEESLSQLLKARDASKTSGSVTLRQWSCSKRTGPSKKSNEIDGCRIVAGDPVPEIWNPSTERNQSTLRSSSAERSHILKFPRSSDNSTTSLRSKREEILSSTVNVKDNMENKSPKPPESNFNQLTEGNILKFPRPPGNCVSSPRSKRVKTHSSAAHTYVKLSEIHPFSLKTKKTTNARKNALLENICLSMKARKCNEKEKPPTLKKPQKDRCIAEMGGWVGKSPSDANEGYDTICGSNEVLGSSSASVNEMHGMRKSDLSKNAMRSDTEEIISEVSLERSNVREETVITSEMKENATLKGLDSALNCHSPDPTIVDSQVGSCLQYLSSDVCPFKYDGQESAAEEVVPISVDAGIILSAEKAVGDIDAKSSETPISNVPSDSSESLEEVERTRPTFGTEVRVEATSPRACANQDMHCADEDGDESIDLICSQTATEMGARVDGGFISNVHHMGCRDVGFEVLQHNSLVTSSRLRFTQDKPMLVNRDMSESPVSAISAISLSPTATSDLKYVEQYSSFGSTTAVQEKSSGSFSYNSATPVDDVNVALGCALVSTASMGRVERKVAISPTKEPARLSDDQRSCCLRKESAYLGAAIAYQESQFSREGIMATKMLPNEGKKMRCNVNSGPDVSNFSTSSSPQINEMGISILESPSSSISSKESLDAAGKLPVYSDVCLASPSSQTHPQPTSNSILRLMGKNLMVVNNDEDESVQLQKVPRGAPHDDSNVKYLTLGFSTGYDSSMIFSQDQCNPLPECDAGYPNSFRNHSNTEARQTPLQQPCNHQAIGVGGFPGSAFQHGGSKGNTDVQAQHRRLNKKQNSPFSYDVERTGLHCQYQKTMSVSEAANSAREVIIIDDSPELGVDLITTDAKYTTVLRENQPLLGGILPPTSLNSSSRPANAFSCFPLANASPLKRGTKSEGSAVLLRSPFILPSPSPSYRNTSLYYFPS